MAEKQVILRKLVGDTLYDIMLKTTASMVVTDSDNDTRLDATLTGILDEIDDIKGDISTMLGGGAAYHIATKLSDEVAAMRKFFEDEDDSESIAAKIVEANATIAAIQHATTGILAVAEKYMDDTAGIDFTTYETVAAYIEHVKQGLLNNVSGSFAFKGVVDYVSELPTEGMLAGDIYQVRYEGSEGTKTLNAEYAYNGTEWVELGSYVDLSPYSTTEQIEAKILSDITTAGKKYTDDEIVRITPAINDSMQVFLAPNGDEAPEGCTTSDMWLAEI